MADVDAAQIHFAAYYFYMDRNLCELYNAVGHPVHSILADGLSFPVVKSACQYQRPAFLDDELLVRTYIARVGRTSFTEVHEFLKLPGRELVAEGRVTHVAVDRKTMQPVPVPEWIRALAADDGHVGAVEGTESRELAHRSRLDGEGDLE